jgi:hypothetical protein
MSKQWVEHVQKYAKANNITCMCAITEASKMGIGNIRKY